MGTLRYLNVMLTVIAVLLGAQLWTQWTMSPAIATTAQAGNTSRAQPFPNAAQQRKEIHDSLQDLNKQVENMSKLFKDGNAKVKVQNFGDMPKQTR